MIAFSRFGANGQLGNQLFQYAFMKSASLRNKCDLLIPKTCKHYKTSSIFDVFKVPDEVMSGPIPASWVSVIQKEFHFTDKYNQMIESGLNIDFAGYFQSEKFFYDFVFDIRSALKFKESVIQAGDAKWLQLRDTTLPACAVHVRRGDSIGKEEWHPIQPIDYYEKALSRVPGYQYFLFSDDIPWCLENLKHLPITFVSGTKDFEDIYLMSRCDAHIIANSTFSWWGAWLSGSRSVIAPARWFGPRYAHYVTKDICPSGWTLM